MPEALLQTKLYVPQLRRNLVPRTSLIEHLDQGLRLGAKLTLISAPAGFGKTTLVAEWLKGKGESGRMKAQESELQPSSLTFPPFEIAWLSLDEGDSDVSRFLTYLVAALQTVSGEIGQGALAMLRSSQPSPTGAILTALINDIAALPGGGILVLDDYHLIQSREAGAAADVNNALSFLLDYLPRQLHLVIATREDPDLPLARLRARGQLTELRAVDLRFSPAEAREFFNQTMGLNLSAEHIAALEKRTEGWIAGLQLAAVALHGQSPGPGQKDAATFINSFSGSHHFVLDYLIEEVLEQQPAGIQRFLLQTAVLDRMNGPLCDALTGQENGRDTLEALDRANLFIIGLDEERRWYRYHHLFADLLQRRLRQKHPEWLSGLNGKASDWSERNGLSAEAIEYALRADDFERMARVLAGQQDALWGSGKHDELQRWLNALPEEVLFASPRLAIYQARYQCNNGQLAEAERTLAAAERSLLSDPDQLELQGRVLATRALISSYRGDVPGIIDYGEQALALLAEDDLTFRSVTALTLGNAHGFRGDMTAAYEARFKALQSCLAAGDGYFILIANLQVAITLREQGRLAQTIEICQRQHESAGDFGLTRTSIAGWLLAVWAEALAEMNDLEGAVERARQGVALTEHGRDLQMFGWSVMCLVRTLFSRGDLAEAKEIIGQVADRARDSQIPPWIANQMATWQARIWLAEGELEAASHWAKERGLDDGSELKVVEEIGFFLLFEYLVLARTLIAQGRMAEANRLLARLLQAAEAGGRKASVIEILVLQALAFSAKGKVDRAYPALAGALELARPEGFVRVFADEGRPMAALLAAMAAEDEAGPPGPAGEPILRQEGMRAYLLQLLAAAGGPEEPRISGAGQRPTPSNRPIVFEPLSERELEVLQLVAEGLTNREIAARLYLSLHTVKVHTRNIYGKLDAHNRTQAVAKAREFGILSSST